MTVARNLSLLSPKLSNSGTVNNIGLTNSAVTINGTSATLGDSVTITDATKLPLAGGTMTGAIAFAAGQTWPTFNQSTTGNAATVTNGVYTTGSQTISGLKTFTGGIAAANPTFTGAVTEQVYTLTGNDLDPSNGTIQVKTLSASVTLTDTLVSGESMLLNLVNAATYIVTWPTITWITSSGNVTPTLTNNCYVVLWKINTTLYGAFIGSGT